MSGFLRFVGIVNAAIWFGASIFFAIGILPGVFSQEVHRLLNESGANRYYSGGVAQILFQRFFALQCLCGAVALIHLFAEKLYLGRNLSRLGTTLVIVLFCFGLIGNFGLLPHMKALRQTSYFGATLEQRDQARRWFGIWHGLSEAANLFIMGGLLIHLVRVTRPPETARYGSFYQIP